MIDHDAIAAQMRETLDRALADYIPGIDRAVHFVSIEQVDMLAEFYLHNRADLSDALLREAMDALQWLREVTEPPDRNCSCHRSAPCGWCEEHAAVAEAHEETRATLAKLREHLEDR